MSMVSKDRMYSSFSGLPRVLLALLLVLRFPGENATELPAARTEQQMLQKDWAENNSHPDMTALLEILPRSGKETPHPGGKATIPLFNRE